MYVEKHKTAVHQLAVLRTSKLIPSTTFDQCQLPDVHLHQHYHHLVSPPHEGDDQVRPLPDIMALECDERPRGHLWHLPPSLRVVLPLLQAPWGGLPPHCGPVQARLSHALHPHLAGHSGQGVRVPTVQSPMGDGQLNSKTFCLAATPSLCVCVPNVQSPLRQSPIGKPPLEYQAMVYHAAAQALNFLQPFNTVYSLYEPVYFVYAFSFSSPLPLPISLTPPHLPHECQCDVQSCKDVALG